MARVPIIKNSYTYALPLPDNITAGVQVNFSTLPDNIAAATIYGMIIITGTRGITPQGVTGNVALIFSELASFSMTLVKDDQTALQLLCSDLGDNITNGAGTNLWVRPPRLIKPQKIDFTKSYVTCHSPLATSTAVMLIQFYYE